MAKVNRYPRDINVTGNDLLFGSDSENDFQSKNFKVSDIIALAATQPGQQGPPGNDGLSAYQIAVENGFEGTEAEWLESLQGNTGVTITKILKTTITQAQILQLRTTPVLILNVAEGKRRIPKDVFLKRLIGTGYTNAIGGFLILRTNGNNLPGSIPSLLLANTSGETMASVSVASQDAGNSDLSAETYRLTILTSDPTGGTGDLEVYVTYHEITL